MKRILSWKAAQHARAGIVAALYAGAALVSGLAAGPRLPEPLVFNHDLSRSYPAAMAMEGNNAEFVFPTAAEREAVDPFVQLAEAGIDPVPLRLAARSLDLDLRPLELAALDRPLETAAIDTREKRCLTHALYYEGRNQGAAGQMAIADVIMNRVENPYYPNTVCGVVYQGSTRDTGCQFSFTCDGSLDRPVDVASMKKSRVIASAVLAGLRVPLSNQALNYHADYMSPYWAPHLAKTARIGDHVFYRPARPTRVAAVQ